MRYSLVSFFLVLAAAVTQVKPDLVLKAPSSKAVEDESSPAAFRHFLRGP
jgi:hypothetical protein